MAAKRILYKNMNEEQKARAKRWAEKWNQEPEDCVMLDMFNGMIVTDPDDLSDVDREAYNIVSLGSRNGYVDDIDDVTDEVRRFYRSEKKKAHEDRLEAGPVILK